jgi:hypothetical protein
MADQCCGSGMFIPDPDFYPSRIQQHYQNQQKRGQGEGLVVLPILSATYFTKLFFLTCTEKNVRQ